MTWRHMCELGLRLALVVCIIPVCLGHSVVVNTMVQQKQDDEDKVWLFAVDGRRKPFQFINDLGELEGFDIDLINEVCQVANKKCNMLLAEFTECTFTNREINYPGRGIMANWFDACPGYAVSVDRQNAFDFTLPYLVNDATFTVVPGNPTHFDPTADDYSNYTITHLTGAFTNAVCLRRLRKAFGVILVAANLPEAKALLLNGTAQVLFSPRSQIADLEVLPQRVTCTDGGAGIMVKKGSSLPAWWNPAFKSYYVSGRFHQLCQEDGVKYNYTIRCM